MEDRRGPASDLEVSYDVGIISRGVAAVDVQRLARYEARPLRR